MSDELISLLIKYRQKGILVDTNILVLYFVGCFNRDRISQFRCTQQFTPEDYDLLHNLLSQFETIVTMPNILTELSNLIGKQAEPERSRCFASFTQHGTILNEFYIASHEIFNHSPFQQFGLGLTDCAIELVAAQNQHLVLTDDLRLAVHLQRQRIETINFNNIRRFDWQ
jgi:rRNA-processing protein FCF1